MNKNLKLAPAIILFAFLFFVTGEVDWVLNDVRPTATECTSSKDCPDFEIEPKLFISVCDKGYCLNKFNHDPL
ncbi:unnamed protein product [Trifolium pratense]|uniref:Uncharacterized protein n=1 Tax=Trifolium pratense TaxID=57577 RepID=A0ACB0LCM2_TRIPR|nr:unnamed protein product [Trifolium pratense]